MKLCDEPSAAYRNNAMQEILELETEWIYIQSTLKVRAGHIEDD